MKTLNDIIKPGMTAEERRTALADIDAAQGNGPKEPTPAPLPPNVPAGLTAEAREKLSDCYVEGVLSKRGDKWTDTDKQAVRAALKRYTEQG